MKRFMSILERKLQQDQGKLTDKLVLLLTFESRITIPCLTHAVVSCALFWDLKSLAKASHSLWIKKWESLSDVVK